MDFGEWIKTNATLLIVGIAVLLGGWFLFGQNNSSIDELDKKTSARLQSIDTKLKTFDATGDEVRGVAANLAKLEKTSAPLSQKVGNLSSELQTITKSIGTVTTSLGTVKNTTGEQIAAVNKKIAAIEAKLADILEQQAKLAKATDKSPAPAPVEAKAQDGVSLGIAENGWLIDNKLYVTLSYVYPGGERVRVGMDGRLYELTKGVSEDFNFEGKRCRLAFLGLDGDKAKVRHDCAS